MTLANVLKNLLLIIFKYNLKQGTFKSIHLPHPKLKIFKISLIFHQEVYFNIPLIYKRLL